MKLQTKIQIAKGSLTLLTLAAFVFMLGLFVLVLCAGLGLNPFKERTTEILIAGFMGLIGAGAVLVCLNVAANISLIADAKMAEAKLQPEAGG